MTSAKPTFQSTTWKGLGSQVSPYQPSDPLPPSRPQTESGTYRTRGVFPPDEAVEDEADAKDDARVQGRCLQEEPQRKRKHLTHQPDVPLERVHPWDKTCGGSVPFATGQGHRAGEDLGQSSLL